MKELFRRTLLAATSALFAAGTAFSRKPEVNLMQAEKSKGRIYEFEMRTIDGASQSLSKYGGRPLLIVNTASLCGFTPQYKDLQALYEKYKGRGLSIAAFPSNEFGAQEPGSDAEIKKFCLMKYSVSFDLYAKTVVKGPAIHPLYKYLTTESGFPGDIPWNFTKFLADKNGKITARFGPEANPAGKEITAAVEKTLAD